MGGAFDDEQGKLRLQRGITSSDYKNLFSDETGWCTRRMR